MSLPGPAMVARCKRRMMMQEIRAEQEDAMRFVVTMGGNAERERKRVRAELAVCHAKVVAGNADGPSCWAWP